MQAEEEVSVELIEERERAIRQLEVNDLGLLMQRHIFDNDDIVRQTQKAIQMPLTSFWFSSSDALLLIYMYNINLFIPQEASLC